MEKDTGIQLVLQMAAANRNLHDELKVSFENIGLTANQALLIHYIASAKSRVSPGDVETLFQITHPSVSRILRDMESMGCITTKPDPKDGRCKCIELTSQAWEKVAQINDRIACFGQMLAQVLSGEEMDTLIQLLGKLTQ